MVVDFHTHVPINDNGIFEITPEEFIHKMDQAGIDCSVVLGVDSGIKSDGAEEKTDFTDEKVKEFCAFNPERLIGFASIHPNRPNPLRKVQNAIENLGLKGVKLYPHRGFIPTDPKLWDVYEYCEQSNVILMFHTGIKALQEHRIIFNSPVYIDEIAVSFPKLKIIMCHGGYPWTEEFLTVAYSNPNIIVDITFLEHIEKTFAIPGFAHYFIKRLVNTIGSKRIVWGSEGPKLKLPLFESKDISYFRIKDILVNDNESLKEEEKDDILGNNAIKLLNLQY